MELSIPASPDFSFKRTVLSHGWYQLLPLELDRERWTLTCVLDAGESQLPVTVCVSSAEKFLLVNVSNAAL